MATPLSTYRLQLRPGFGFDDAADVAGYLADLGITHAYCSPYLQAAPGSTHGYDVVDHSRLNEELGGAAGHTRLCAALRDAGLGLVLDVVPNHMAITPENRWWTDVLENGPASLYAGYFDVDWGPPEPGATVLMPVLGDHYGRVLEAGGLAVEREEGTFVVRYADQRFPLAPRSLRALLEPAAASLSGGPAADELTFLASAFADLAPPTALPRDRLRRRHRDKEVLELLLGRLCRESAPAAAALDVAVDQVNGDVELLDQLLRSQNYRLSSWRVAGQEIDYRRFFDVSSMAALRVEDDQVFDDTHALVLRLVAEGVVDGLRVDHPDGLRDPAGYLRRLARSNPSPWLVVEKILGADERLPSTWPVAGTTGYDFLNVVGGLFVDPAGEVALDEAYSSFTGETAGWTEVARAKRHEVMEEALTADVQRVLALLAVLTDATRGYRDFTRPELDAALREVIASFGVYRTYVEPDGAASEADRAQVAKAVAAAVARGPEVAPELAALLGSVLLGRVDGRSSPQALEVCLRAQQLSGPVMAKGVEDTAFYTFNRLVSLNEVGGDPGRFGTSVAAFHERMVENQRRWPGAMLASSTHDTKRSEDVRARISLLSEIPEELAAAVRRWAALNDAHRTTTRSGSAWPDRNLEWLLYQTLVGAHPLPVGRALAYVEKATREAKVHTSWVDPNPEYDEAVRRFVKGVLADRSFLTDLDDFVAPLVEPGWRTSLAAQLLKLTAPGVPDVYQGTELWDDSLVDPDNRRPVDFERRRRLLRQLDGLGAEGAWQRAVEGLPKLLVTRTALRLRRRLPAPFGPGEDGRYEPVASEGAGAGHVVAFVRGGRVATVVPRLVLGLQRRGGWADTSVVLPAGRWRQELTGGVVEGGATSVASLLAGFPVALLVREVP